MAALPYMQLYVADYLADTMHLTTEEHDVSRPKAAVNWRASRKELTKWHLTRDGGALTICGRRINHHHLINLSKQLNKIDCKICMLFTDQSSEDKGS